MAKCTPPPEPSSPNSPATPQDDPTIEFGHETPNSIVTRYERGISNLIFQYRNLPAARYADRRNIIVRVSAMHATLYKLEEMEHDALSGEIGVIEERIRFQEELESESIVEMREPGEMEEVERLNVLRAKREALGLKMHKRMEERNKVEGFRRQIEKAARKAGVDIGPPKGMIPTP